jgi:hypothetical protein
MSATITGVVTNGVVVPSSPLPEGTQVEIVVRTGIPPELQEELDAWQYGSSEALALVERLAEEAPTDETR